MSNDIFLLEPKCSFEFEFVITNRNSLSISLNSHIIDDFNGDQNLDIAFLDNKKRFLKVLLGYGNGSFSVGKKISTGKLWNNRQIYVKDFNGDQIFDIGFGLDDKTRNILIGDGFGDFHVQPIFSSHFKYEISIWIGIGDFNNDGYIDIIEVDINSEKQEIFLNKCQWYSLRDFIEILISST